MKSLDQNSKLCVKIFPCVFLYLAFSIIYIQIVREKGRERGREKRDTERVRKCGENSLLSYANNYIREAIVCRTPKFNMQEYLMLSN